MRNNARAERAEYSDSRKEVSDEAFDDGLAGPLMSLTAAVGTAEWVRHAEAARDGSDLHGWTVVRATTRLRGGALGCETTFVLQKELDG